MDAGRQQGTRAPVRVLVASALGGVVEPLLAEHFGNVTVAKSADELESVLLGRLRYDVAVVDLVWHSYALEWEYDGLDAISRLQSSGRSAPVVVAAQGYGLERDHLEEAYRHPLVRGAVLKAAGVHELVGAIERVATGGLFWSRSLPEDIRGRYPTVGGFLEGHPLAAHVAGAIASLRAGDWDEVTGLVPYKYSSVATAPRLFGDALCAWGEVEDPARVNQAIIFRWCGEHGRYIVSWCRRHGLVKYTRPQLG